MTNIICGINAVKETLKQDKGIVELFIAKGRKIGRVREILDLAREKKIPIKFKDRIYLDRLSPGFSHQGILAILANYSYCAVEDLIETSNISALV